MPKVQVATMADRNGSSSTSSEWCIDDAAHTTNQQPTRLAGTKRRKETESRRTPFLLGLSHK